ncbi:hypothetical protein ACH4E5_03035 [Streptomyces afghaniensis]|uniref:hypothetical protein n=1 Tax=Streptomyces afghaniensis TaxID=66865 RepID=UPI0037B464BC
MHRTARTAPGTGSARPRIAILAAVVLVLLSALGIAGPTPGTTGEPVSGTVAAAGRDGAHGPRVGDVCGTVWGGGPRADDVCGTVRANGPRVGDGWGTVCVADGPRVGDAGGTACATGPRADDGCGTVCVNGPGVGDVCGPVWAGGPRADDGCGTVRVNGPRGGDGWGPVCVAHGPRVGDGCGTVCVNGPRTDDGCGNVRANSPRADDGCGTVCAVRAAPRQEPYGELPAPRGHLAARAPGADVTPADSVARLPAPAVHTLSSDPHAPRDRGRAPPATSGS